MDWFTIHFPGYTADDQKLKKVNARDVSEILEGEAELSGAPTAMTVFDETFVGPLIFDENESEDRSHGA